MMAHNHEQRGTCNSLGSFALHDGLLCEVFDSDVRSFYNISWKSHFHSHLVNDILWIQSSILEDVFALLVAFIDFLFIRCNIVEYALEVSWFVGLPCSDKNN